jgi:hypothetical protein
VSDRRMMKPAAAYPTGLTRPLSWRQIKGGLRDMGSEKKYPGCGCLSAVVISSSIVALLWYWLGL